MKKIFILLLISLITLLPAMAVADKVLDVPVINLDFIRDDLGTRYDCGVGVMDEVFAYYDKWEDIVPGQTSGDVPDNTKYILDLHEYLMTHSGFNGSYVDPATLSYWFNQYFLLHGVSATVIRDRGPTWAEVVSEINANRPVPLLIYGANHYVLITGYKTNPDRLVVLWNHYPEVREITYTQLVLWRPLETWYIRTDIDMLPPDETQPDPTTEPWYAEALQWCNANGWEIEPED